MTTGQSLDAFLEQLASSAPTPGGGGAAGLMGAMGAALVAMVCNLTVGKEKFSAVEGEMRAVLATAEELRAALVGAIEDDVAVFDRVMAAYKLPKDSDAEKAARAAEIQAALRGATEVPLECARLCARVIELSRETAVKGNPNVVSDAGVAVMAALAALKSAALNVHINLGSIKDEAFASAAGDEIAALTAAADRDADEIYQLVKSRL